MNWFKRKEKAEQKEVAIVATAAGHEVGKKQYPKEVMEIHHEFSIAGEALLQEALCVLKKAETVSFDKAKRLLSLGFQQAQEAKEGAQLMKQIEVSRETADLVKYYQIQYPNNKFITEAQVKAICDKWNLVCGETSRYKGFVPEKNLKQIESFKLKKKELESIIVTGARTYAISRLSNQPVEDFCIEDAEIRKVRSYYHIFKKGSKEDSTHAFQSSDGIDFYAKDTHDIFGLNHIGDIRFRIGGKGLLICAPLKDMDTTDLRLVDGYRLQHIPDPVILQQVKGGYLIITAWGDEASDENVVNQGMN
jgi:hypothetical protein